VQEQLNYGLREMSSHSQYHLRKQVGSSDPIRVRGWVLTVRTHLTKARKKKAGLNCF